MKKIYFFLFAMAICSMAMEAVNPPITFRGEKLEYDTTFTRIQVGETPTYIPEVSGMSCSHVTPGYLWIQSDEVFRIAAINPKGDIFSKIVFKDCPKHNGTTRRDWEALSTGVWQGKNYLFVGAVGDNDEQYKDEYYILYMEEPEIGNVVNPVAVNYSVGTNYIRYGYPDGRAHNTEAIMYDNVDQTMYIIDKVYQGVNTVYSLRMDTTYGNDLQILTEVCKLGNEGEYQFQRVTAADETPDGKYIIIKNNYSECDTANCLIWVREEANEPLSQTLQRQPKQIEAYLTEWQGEAIAWLDSTTFYTTSDDDGSAPIYVYVRWGSTADMEFVSVPQHTDDPAKYISNGKPYIAYRDETYTITGQKIQ